MIPCTETADNPAQAPLSTLQTLMTNQAVQCFLLVSVQFLLTTEIFVSGPGETSSNCRHHGGLPQTKNIPLPRGLLHLQGQVQQVSEAALQTA